MAVLQVEVPDDLVGVTWVMALRGYSGPNNLRRHLIASQGTPSDVQAGLLLWGLDLARGNMQRGGGAPPAP